MYGKFHTFEVRLIKLTIVSCGCILSNIYKHFILSFVAKFSALLLKSSRIMRIPAPAALAFAQDIYKEYYFRIIIERSGTSMKIKPK